MSSPITFDRPLLLLLLPALGFAFWAIARKSYAGQHPTTRQWALVMRCVVAGLLVLALAGAHLVKRTDRLTTLFLLDVSKSISPNQRAQGLHYLQKALDGKGGTDRAGVIVFGRSSFEEAAPTETLSDTGGIHASVTGDATNITDALRLAQMSFPADTGKKIVLLSDGNENIGDAGAEIESLRESGVRIDIAPTALGNQSGAAAPEALVQEVALPVRARAGAPFALRAVVSSTVDQSATLHIERDGQVIGQEKVTLHPGKNVFAYSQKTAQNGFHRYDVSLMPTQDTMAENNHGYGYVSVVGRPRVLYVAEPGSPGVSSLKIALAGQQIDMDVQPPGALPGTVASLVSYDTILLSDVPAQELGTQQMSAIESSVKNFGVGLGMIGGLNSFAAGQYKGTPIEAALPVSMDVPKNQKLPSAAVVIVLDASGSMSATESGIEKVQLGARAAVKLMDALRPDDEVAVTSVTESTTLVVPLQSASNTKAAQSEISGVAAGGGGIYCLQGLEDAYALLAQSHAPIKHVIMCADTTDSEQQEGCVALARQMLLTRHISTTICGIGNLSDPHVAFQRAVARAGGGQLFVVNEAAALPGLFQRDVQSIQQSLYLEKPFFPRITGFDPILAGVSFAATPQLLGYDLTTVKPGATVALSAPDTGAPIFAHWRYDLGRTFAFTSDDRPHWAAHWLPWQEYPRFWTQALRWSFRSNADTDFQASVENSDGKGHLSVDAFSATGSLNDQAQLTAHVTAPDLTGKSVTLQQTAPGHFEGQFDADQIGSYMVQVSHAGGAHTAGQTLGLVVPYSAEYRTVGANLPLLTRLAEETGGAIQHDPARVFRDAPSWVIGKIDLVPVLLLVTALLFLLDVAVRRLALRPQMVRDTARLGLSIAEDRVAKYREAHTSPSLQVNSPQMSRLLERKAALRVPQEEDSSQVPKPSVPKQGVLTRRAIENTDDENPFPYVAALPRARTSDKTEQTSQNPPASGYTGRLLDAKKRAEKKDV